MNIFRKAISSIFKTKDKIRNTFSSVLSFSNLNENEVERIEECLLSADIGWSLVEKIIDKVFHTVQKKQKNYMQKYKEVLQKKVIKNI